MKFAFKILLVLGILISTTSSAQTITKQQANEDIEQFRAILLNQSSYLFSKGLNPNAALDKLAAALEDTVDIENLFYGFMKIVGNIGDRHARVRWSDLKSDALGLPFIMAPMDGKIVALKKELKDGKYQLLHKKHPYVKAINGMSIQDFVKAIAWAYKYAPNRSKVHYATRERRYDFLLSTIFGHAEAYKFTFTDGVKDKTVA